MIQSEDFAWAIAFAWCPIGLFLSQCGHVFPICSDVFTDVYVVKKNQTLLYLTELFTFTELIKGDDNRAHGKLILRYAYTEKGNINK